MSRWYRLLVAAIVAFGGVVQAADVRLAVMGPPGGDLGGLVPLAEVAIGTLDGVTLVEREAIESVLKEQQLQAAFGAGSAGDRVELGRILKADILVLLRDRGEPKPHVEAVISETKQGIRLLTAPLPAELDAKQQAARVRELAEQAIAKREFSDLVAVPPLVNNSLTRDLDHFQGAYAKLIEESIAGRDSLAVIELAEAKAIAGELTLAGGEKIARKLPYYLEGEFRGEGHAEKCRVAFTLRLMRGNEQLAERSESDLEPGKVGAAISASAGAMLDEAIGRSAMAFDLKAETKRLEQRIEAHLAIGNWDEALALAEASLLIDPEQPKVHSHALTVLATQIQPRAMSVNSLSREHFVTILPLMMAALSHVEACLDQTIPGSQSWGARTFSWPDFASGYSQLGRQQIRKVCDDATYGQWLSFHERMKGIASRVLDQKVAARVDDDAFRILHPWLLSENFAEKPVEYAIANFEQQCDERYELAKKFRYLKNGNCPFPTFSSPMEWLPVVQDEEKRQAMYDLYWKYIDELEALDSPWMNAYLKNYRKVMRPRGLPEFTGHTGPWVPDHKTRPAPVARPVLKTLVADQPDARFLPIESFVIESPDGDMTVSAASLEVETWLPIQEGIELVITRTHVFLMKTKGRLKLIPLNFQPLWATPSDNWSPGNRNFCWDGRFVWGVSPAHEGQFLVAIDPSTEQVWKVGADKGLPPMGQVRGAALTAVAPGKAFVAGYFGRSWVATANLDPKQGIEFEVFHEARVVDVRPAQSGPFKPNMSSDVARPCFALYTVKDLDAAPGVTRPLVFVDCESALLGVDPETKHVRSIDFFRGDIVESAELRAKLLKPFRQPHAFYEDLVSPQESTVDRSERVWKFKDAVKGPTPFRDASLELESRFFRIDRKPDNSGWGLFTGIDGGPKGRLMTIDFPSSGEKPLLFRSKHYGLVVRLRGPGNRKDGLFMVEVKGKYAGPLGAEEDSKADEGRTPGESR